MYSNSMEVFKHQNILIKKCNSIILNLVLFCFHFTANSEMKVVYIIFWVMCKLCWLDVMECRVMLIVWSESSEWTDCRINLSCVVFFYLVYRERSPVYYIHSINMSFFLSLRFLHIWFGVKLIYWFQL